MIAPFHELRKKGTHWVWKEEHTKAFQDMKRVLTSAPILAWPDPNGQYVLYTDGSKQGLGAVLGQVKSDGAETVVQYWTKTLNDTERRRSAPQLELYALVRAIKEMHPYLAGRPFTVVTDHWALQWLRRMKNPDGLLGRWALSLQEYDFQVRYRKGAENHVDCLSRPPDWYTQYWKDHPEQDSGPQDAELPIAAATISSNRPSLGDRECYHKEVWPVSLDGIKTLFTELGHSENPIIAATNSSPADNTFRQWMSDQAEDSRTSKYLKYLRDGSLPRDAKKARRVVAETSHMFLDDYGLLRSFNKFGDLKDASGGPVLVVPASKQGEVIRNCHDGALAGHFGLWKTYLRIARNYWWKGMYADVARHVRSCAECQSCKGPVVHGSEPQPIPVGGPFERIGIDFVGKLPNTRGGNAYVLVVTDYLTKWAEAFAVPNQSSDIVAQYLLEEIICRYGVPRELNSDRGSGFLNRVVSSIVRLLGVRQHFTSAWHPQCNGLTEKVNGTLTSSLRTLASKNHRGWDTFLPYCLFAYRTSVHASTKYTPFFLLHGWEARMPLDWETNKPYSRKYANAEDYRADMAKGLDLARELARDNIEKAQHTNQIYSKHKRFTTFEVGDPVYVRNMHRSDEARAISKKLLPLWEGPYEVLERIGAATYRLVHSARLGGRDKILKGTFHLERLKLAQLRQPVVSPSSPVARPSPVETVDTETGTQNEGSCSESNHNSEPAIDHGTPAQEARQSSNPDPTASTHDTLARDQGPGPVQGSDEYEVEKVLGRQRRIKGYFYKVQWRGYRGTSWVHENQCNEELVHNYDKDHPRARWRRRASPAEPSSDESRSSVPEKSLVAAPLALQHLPFANTRAYVTSATGIQLYIGETMHKGMGLFTYDHIHQHSTIDDYLGEASHSPIYGQHVIQGGTRHSQIWLDGNPALHPTTINGVLIGQQGSARAAYATRSP